MVGVSGSLPEGSRTRIAPDAALGAAVVAGATTELADLRSRSFPSNVVDGTVPDADRLRARVARADGDLLATPNDHGSYSGLLKEALDVDLRVADVDRHESSAA